VGNGLTHQAQSELRTRLNIDGRETSIDGVVVLVLVALIWTLTDRGCIWVLFTFKAHHVADFELELVVDVY
jgi:hypothetical protein